MVEIVKPKINLEFGVEGVNINNETVIVKMECCDRLLDKVSALEKEKAGLVEKVELRGNMIIALQDTCKRQMDELYEVHRNLKEALAKIEGGK